MAGKNTPAILKPGPDIDVILLGKSGHGKSATGNSILGRQEFKSLGGACSITDKYHIGATEVDKRVIKVVDIPGLCDTSSSSKQEMAKIVVDAFSQGISHFPRGFSAIILVLSYTVRMTEEEKEAIDVLKMIFGKDLIKKYTVCVFTHGDSFKHDHGADEDFQIWCREQSIYKELLEECEYRFVLFDNKTRDFNEKRSQLTDLVSKIDILKGRQTRYTVDNLKTGENFLLDLESYSKENALIKDDLNKTMHGPQDKKFDNLKKLEARAINLLTNVSQVNHRMFSNLKKDLETMTRTIETFKGLLQQQEQERMEREKLEKRMDGMQMERDRDQQRKEEEMETLRDKIKMMEGQIRGQADKAETEIQEQRKGSHWMDIIKDMIMPFVQGGLPTIISFVVNAFKGRK